MNGGLNVEICDSDLNCCNAGSLDSDRDDFYKGIKLAYLPLGSLIMTTIIQYIRHINHE